MEMLFCVQQNTFSHVNVFSLRFFTLSIDNPTYVMQICFVLIPRYCCRYHQSRTNIESPQYGSSNLVIPTYNFEQSQGFFLVF